MNACAITVLYSSCVPGRTPAAFPAQTLRGDQIQLLPVPEEDSLVPHRNSLDVLSDAQGDYTILLEEGDLFAENFLETLLSCAREFPSSFVMPEMFCRHFHEFPAKKTPEPAVVLRADDAPSVFPAELHGLLFPTAALQEAAEASSGAEREKRILLYLLRRNPEFTFLKSCALGYTRIRESDYQYSTCTLTHAWYDVPLKKFLLPLLLQEAESPDAAFSFSQYLALHMVWLRLAANRNNRNRFVILPEELPAYLDLLSEVLSLVGDEAILNRAVINDDVIPAVRLMELRLKRKDWSWLPSLKDADGSLKLMCGKYEFGSLSKIAPLRVNLIEYRNGCLELDGEYSDFFSEKDTAVCARFGSKIYFPVYNRRLSSTKFFGRSFFRMKTFHISIPVSCGAGSSSPKGEEPQPPRKGEDRLLNFYIRYGGKEYRMEYGFPSYTSRFARDFTCRYWRFGEYLAFWNGKGIHVLRSGRALVLRREFLLWLQIWKAKNGLFRGQLPLKILNFMLRPWFSRRHIWLFMDKIYKGGDSSEYLYRYAAAKNDGIRKYYLLDRHSADYARMRRDGYRPLVRGSLKHRLVFLNADMVIASNSTVFEFNGYTFTQSLPVCGDTHFGVACVQHGMSVQKIALAQQRLRDNTKLYFCASKYEIQNLSHPAYDYTGYDALRLTGVPRYDGLKSRAQKILLFSPTWRMNAVLPAAKSEGFARDYNPHFRETPYFRVYNSLINDPRLLNAVRKYGYRIQYVLHPIISPQAEDFTKNDLVEIIPSVGDMSYEKLFCEAALMVTDFSGVQFDFAYMRKPVVYLHHHDIPQHYEEGSFFYKTMGFGEICRTNDGLIDVLCHYMENNCEMPEMYRKRADDFFAFSDHENCARIYPELLKYQKEHYGA